MKRTAHLPRLYFSIYWNNGRFQVISGQNLEIALNNAGIGPDKAQNISAVADGGVQTKWWSEETSDWSLTNLWETASA